MAESMVGGAQQKPTEDGCSVIQAKLWPSTKLAKEAALAHRPGYFRLDNAFVLIHGHPHPCEDNQVWTCGPGQKKLTEGEERDTSVSQDGLAMTETNEPQVLSEKPAKSGRSLGEVKLPYNPIDSAMKTPDHARRTIQGILDSYNSNYDALAEAVQNSMDALEDAALAKLPAPYLLEITVDLQANSLSVLDTGIGMTQEQVCESFAPSATYKDLPAPLKKRGDKHPYRGYKGVGLTFLAYGTDDVQIQSRQNGAIVKGRMRFGRGWVTGKQPDAPVLDIDAEPSPLDKHKRGTYLKLQFSSDTRPESLARLGSSIEVWEAIVRTRTAAGQIFIGETPAANFKVILRLITKDGPVEKEVAPEFYYPHLVSRQPPFRFLDVGPLFEKHPAIADIPDEYKRQDAVYVNWDVSKIKEHLEKDEQKDFKAELDAYTPKLYAFRPYYAPLWTAINEAATKQVRAHFFSGGLVIGLNHQRIADTIRVEVSRSDFTGQQVFVLLHFDKARPDQGRKPYRPGSWNCRNLLQMMLCSIS